MVESGGDRLDAGLDALLDVVRHAHAVVTADGQVVAWNEAFATLAGRLGVGVTAAAALLAAQADLHGDSVGADGSSAVRLTFPGLADGSMEVIASASAGRGVDGTTLHFVTVVDLDELGPAATARRAEAAERTAVAVELRRSNAELEAFAALAAHDLQEPLRKIRAFGDRLVSTQQERLDDRGRDYLARMTGAAERMQRLIDDLLEYSRAALVAPAPSTIDLAELVRGALASVDSDLRRVDGTVTVGPLPTVRGNAARTAQVLANLLGNAVRFAHGDRPLQVDIRLVDDAAGDGHGVGGGAGAVTVLVRDNGIGFDDRYRELIFEPFERLGTDRTGTGMGLAICRRIMRSQGGDITANGADSGATFRLVFQPGGTP